MVNNVKNTSEIFIGLMSGTSIDAIDAAAARISHDKVEIIAVHSHQIPNDVKQAIADLCQPGENEIERMGELDHRLGHLFAEATHALLAAGKISASDVSAIGSHGQTIRHMPNNTHPFTLQIGNPALITELTGISTIADFRQADMAAGGQGAPLVPAFHHAVFYDKKINRVILNIGGMSNISILEKNKISGFDTGPGNILLNEWIQQHKSLPYDENGEWSKNGSVNNDLLKKMLNDDYFLQPPPKSTGREKFNLQWISQKLSGIKDTPKNIQSTLCELTAQSIADAIKEHSQNCEEILVCGGGVHNADLLSRLNQKCSAKIISSMTAGVDPDYVEAAAFAWFARQTLHNLPSNAPMVTGAKRPVLLGAIYPAY